MKSNTILHGSSKYQKPWSGFVCHGWGVHLILSISSPPDISESNLLRLGCFITFSAFIFPNSSIFPAVPYHLISQILLPFLLSMAISLPCKPLEKKLKLHNLISVYPWQWTLALTAFPSKYLKENKLQHKNNFNTKKKKCLFVLTGSRSSSASRRAVRGFSCMSSVHSLSEAGGDSARSGKSSLVLGPRKRILSRRFSMVNTAHLGFTLTWWTATL